MLKLNSKVRQLIAIWVARAYLMSHMNLNSSVGSPTYDIQSSQSQIPIFVIINSISKCLITNGDGLKVLLKKSSLTIERRQNDVRPL